LGWDHLVVMGIREEEVEAESTLADTRRGVFAASL
jgi:hypothetical protein